MTDTTALRRKFEDEIKALASRLESIEKDIQAPKSADWEEQAVDSENDEVLDALDVATRGKIDGLQSALGKLDAGTYGVCETCDEAISAKRLEALAWASHCVNCAE